MSVVSPDFGCAIISAKTGQRLCFSRLGRYLETPNWILSVRVVGMVGSSQVVARRKGRFALWKRLGNIQNVVAHPSEDVVFFVDQWGALQRVELVRDRTIGGSLSGPKLAVSQSGRYVACSTWFGVSIYDGSTCELLSCIEARGVFVGDDSDWGDSYDELRWIGDDYLWSHSSVWWATDSRDWRKPQLLEGLRIQEDFVSDANGLVVEISEGELIFYDLPNRKVLGTLHILGKDWFCFTPAGLWDSSLDSPTGVRPEPVAADRVSGLLETFVTRDPDN